MLTKLNTTTMKSLKFLLIGFAVSSLALVSCGDKAKEAAERAQFVADSIARADSIALADSLSAVAIADSLARLEAIHDSLMQAAENQGNTRTTTPKAPSTPKPPVKDTNGKADNGKIEKPTDPGKVAEETVKKPTTKEDQATKAAETGTGTGVSSPEGGSKGGKSKGKSKGGL